MGGNFLSLFKMHVTEVRLRKYHCAVSLMVCHSDTKIVKVWNIEKIVELKGPLPYCFYKDKFSMIMDQMLYDTKTFGLTIETHETPN